MKTLLIGLLFGFCGLVQGQVHVAVGDFENRSDWVYLDSWARNIPDYLQHELSRDPGIVLVERHQLQTILQEQTLGMTGLVDSSNAQEVGRLISAQYIVTGTVNREEGWLRIDAKIINTGTGKVITEKVQSRNRSRLNEMLALLGNNLRYQLNGQGSYKPSLKVRQYPTRIFAGITLASAVSTVIVNNLYQDKKGEYLGATQLSQFDARYKSANRLHKTRNVLTWMTTAALAGTLYFWIYNLSPEEILAAEPRTVLYGFGHQGEWGLGVQIRL
ncbi:hypothetical protein JW948_14490 [bacterium]|nr:hypothetical protein [bacterium]